MILSLLFGVLIGFALGLTGGGGSVFAVPLLVYGLDIPAHQAVVISLAAVGATALGGGLARLRDGQAELRTALIFGLSGSVGAPLGAWLNPRFPATALLTGFALLMLAVAARMWRQAHRQPEATRIVRAGSEPDRRDEADFAGRGVDQLRLPQQPEHGVRPAGTPGRRHRSADRAP